ncbi:ORC1-type DNA replication protein [Halorubrum lacusprofundi]|jgi:cell division control protein 6|uniref:ORC1-type DNA replication protein n=1 Tax=Halorubrum lacusprofundi (strain ATCC 49239 / DSM 5036 / JCM 8891 / ACAM 34) TaxID=416348 RepID=B9LU08_HALLT|nr:ORC1-type DNA replication protein [Halorubrum lacusprofundi]ACM58202.1 orc1/cdc6 family replication initiation protein [Halorubrum lacusprofundi ATCC 49239]MCG1006285.1 ORC1-type DNA replication protein [Halorubrum lacusprofundi]
MTGDAGGDMLSWDESVFRDESVFEIDHVPETFRHRESQLESLKYALRPAVRGSRPLNTIVRGPPGTGKTTAVQKLFGELSARTDVRTVRVNCQVDSTRYAVFSRLFEGIFDYEPPSSGISFKKLFGQITDRLVEEDDVLVVALDDVNYLFYENEASDTLYSLLRAHEAHSGAKIGVIVVSSDLGLDVIDDLDTRVQSVFRPEEVYFPVYGAAEIYDILFERAKRGFHDGVIGDAELERIADLTAESGDLRVGIDLLRRAGLNAEMRASKTIDEEDVESAYDKSKHVHLSRSLRGLSESERALVRVLAENDGERAGTVYEAFHEETDLGYTRYSEIINKLDQLGVIDAEYADVEGRGRSRELSLAYEAETVLDRLE